jgi:hypothetical protein
MTRDDDARERDARSERAEMPASEEESTTAQAQEHEPETGGEPAETPEAGETETAEAGAEEVGPLDVYAVLRISVAQLSGVAFQMMGLHADPITNTVRKDLAQARLAIDAASALVEKLLPHLHGQEARDYQNLLNDLRLNFIRQSGEEQQTQ